MLIGRVEDSGEEVGGGDCVRSTNVGLWLIRRLPHFLIELMRERSGVEVEVEEAAAAAVGGVVLEEEETANMEAGRPEER